MGAAVGALLGDNNGSRVGVCDGLTVGPAVGALLGDNDPCVGLMELIIGALEGLALGLNDGGFDGLVEGLFLG